MVEYILKLDIDESELGRKIKRVLGGMNVGGGGQATVVGGGVGMTPAMVQKEAEARLKKLTISSELIQKQLAKSGEMQRKGFLGHFGPQLFKLAGIAMGVGALTQLGKGLIDASPLLQAMMKIFSTAITLFLRPFGDFIAMLLRPFILMMLKYAINFYKNFGKPAIELGTTTGLAIFEPESFKEILLEALREERLEREAEEGPKEEKPQWQKDFELAMLNLMKFTSQWQLAFAETRKPYQGPSVCPTTGEFSSTGGKFSLDTIGETFEEFQTEQLKDKRRAEFEESRSLPGMTYAESQAQIRLENEEKRRLNVLERERAEAMAKQLELAEKTKVLGPESIYGNFAKEFFETGGYKGGYESEERKFGLDRLEGVLGIGPDTKMEDLKGKVDDAIDCICDFWNNAACILTLIEAGALTGMDRETKEMLQHIVRMKKAGATMADYTTKTGLSIKAAYEKMLMVLKSLQIRAAKNDATSAQKFFGGAVCACQVVDVQTSGGFGQSLSGFRGANGKVYKSIREALDNNPANSFATDIDTGQKYRYIEPQSDRGAIESFAKGGILTEPVMGVGQRSGKQYLLGERGPEAVVPLDGSCNMGGPINVTFNVNGVFNSSDFESSVKPMVLRWFKEVKSGRGII